MVNKFVCTNCSRIVQKDHLAKMVDKAIQAKYWNSIRPTGFYMDTEPFIIDDNFIKYHTPIEIPKEHEYIINIILNLHGRNWT